MGRGVILQVIKARTFHKKTSISGEIMDTRLCELTWIFKHIQNVSARQTESAHTHTHTHTCTHTNPSFSIFVTTSIVIMYHPAHYPNPNPLTLIAFWRKVGSFSAAHLVGPAWPPSTSPQWEISIQDPHGNTDEQVAERNSCRWDGPTYLASDFSMLFYLPEN